MSRVPERFASFGLIEWWDQARVAEMSVLVVGAGALGNEIIKNCALFGVRNLAIVDLDSVETSNLSRSVLFRPSDAGVAKAHAAACAAREIYPDVSAVALRANVVHDVGLGLFRWADVVIGGLDNREARLTVNRACYRVGTPWIDGAIEALSGVARVFLPPAGPCYECTMDATDWRLLEQRHSCSLLNRELADVGKVPTTPTTASIIAGIQCQEALKLVHGRQTLAGQGFVFDGHAHQSYVVDYQRNPDCMSHDTLQVFDSLSARVGEMTGRELLVQARRVAGPRAHVRFARELLRGLECATCGESQRIFRPLSAVSERDAICPRCGARRAPLLFHSLFGDEDWLDLTMADMGLPPWDIVTAVSPEGTHGLEFAGDRAAVLKSVGPIRVQGVEA